jgi:hypothetical protein
MKTIHEANGLGPRVEESRAPAILAKVRRLDPHLIDALQDPDNTFPDGRISIRAVARALNRTVPEFNRDLATIRQLVAV